VKLKCETMPKREFSWKPFSLSDSAKTRLANSIRKQLLFKTTQVITTGGPELNYRNRAQTDPKPTPNRPQTYPIRTVHRLTSQVMPHSNLNKHTRNRVIKPRSIWWNRVLLKWCMYAFCVLFVLQILALCSFGLRQQAS
jgi:hypothetical protein